MRKVNLFSPSGFYFYLTFLVVFSFCELFSWTSSPSRLTILKCLAKTEPSEGSRLPPLLRDSNGRRLEKTKFSSLIFFAFHFSNYPGPTNVTKIMSLGFVYFAFLNFLTFAASCQDNPGELCFVALLYRHGDRAPIGSYPKDPYSSESYWPNGWGQLTKLGKLQQYELGKWIRHHYWDFLPVDYSPKDIYVQSTDVDRTLVSAYWNLAGLYECWYAKEGEGLMCQTIPVHTTPVRMDMVLSSHKPCPKYDALLADCLKSEQVSAANELYSKVFCELSAHTGLKIKSVSDCLHLASVLNIQNLYGFALPNWTVNYFPQPLGEIVEFAFKIPCLTTKMKRLKCGPLVKDIVQHMEDKINGNITQKIWMYSAHDTTLANFMMCLNVYDGIVPAYTAMVILELYKLNNEYYVVVSYKTPTTYRILRLPCCERVCPFREFQKIVKCVTPDDWESECVSGC